MGYVFLADDVITSKKLPTNANGYTAELSALHDAIAYARRAASHRDVTLVTDSRSSIQAITKLCNWNKLVQQIQHIILDSDLNFNLYWMPSHVGIAQNERIDVASGESIQLEYIENAQLPREDIKSVIKNVVNKKWKGTPENKLQYKR